MSASTVLPHNHARVVAVSPALNASTRAALWPAGVPLAQLQVMERAAGVKPAAPAPAKVVAKPAAPVAAKPARAAPPAPKPSHSQSQSHAMIYHGVPKTAGCPLARAAQAAVSQFNQEFSK